MDMIQTILLVFLVILNLIILFQVRAFFKELRTPIVKKASANQKYKTRKQSVATPAKRRDNRGDQLNQRNQRNSNPNRNRRNRKNERPNRSPRKQAPVVGNEAANMEKESSNNPENSVAPVSKAENSKPEGRRPLKPRVAENAESSVSEKKSKAEKTASAGAQNEFDPSQIRHGRRVTVKKPPQLEEETGN
ncbi:MAG: hypothetical protein GX801_10355 [Fibrobacter sp.]|nr:hypothetical protein [Fibrobacter sp.]